MILNPRTAQILQATSPKGSFGQPSALAPLPVFVDKTGNTNYGMLVKQNPLTNEFVIPSNQDEKPPVSVADNLKNSLNNVISLFKNGFKQATEVVFSADKGDSQPEIQPGTYNFVFLRVPDFIAKVASKFAVGKQYQIENNTKTVRILSLENTKDDTVVKLQISNPIPVAVSVVVVGLGIFLAAFGIDLVLKRIEKIIGGPGLALALGGIGAIVLIRKFAK